MKRPFSVTLLAVAVFLLAMWNAWQAVTAAQQLAFMRSLGVEVPALVLIVTGATWAIGLGVAAIGVWRVRAWGRRWLLLISIVYPLQNFIERLALQRAPYEDVTRPAALIVTLLIVAGVWSFLFQPKIRQAFNATITESS